MPNIKSIKYTLKGIGGTILYVILYVFTVARGLLGLEDLTFLEPLRIREDDVNKEKGSAK